MSSIKSNYFFNTANQIINMAVQIITVPYVTRVLGAENLGIYAYTYSIATYFVMFIVLGLSNYGNREIAKVKNDKKKLEHTFSSIYIMQVLCGLFIILLYAFSIVAFFKSYKLIFLFQVIYIVSGVLDINWAMYGLEEFKFTAVRNTVISCVNLICILLFVRTKESLLVYTIIMSVGALTNQITAWLYISKKIHFTRVTLTDVVKHIKPNLVLFIPTIAVSIYKIMDKIMLGYIANMEQVGFYESAEKIIRIPTVLISSLGTVMLPRMVMLYSENSVQKSKDYMQKSMDFAILLSTAMSFGIMSVAREFVPLYYGCGFDECISLYVILLPSCLFLAFSNVVRTQYLIPKGKDKIFIKGVITGAFVNLILNLLLIPHFNSKGAAIATLIAEISVCVSQAYDVRKELNIKEYVKRGLPFVCVGSIMFASLFFLNISKYPIISLVAKVSIGIVFYIGISLVIVRRNPEIYNYNIDKKQEIKKTKS